jgi:hypothetical protein
LPRVRLHAGLIERPEVFVIVAEIFPALHGEVFHDAADVAGLDLAIDPLTPADEKVMHVGNTGECGVCVFFNGRINNEIV